MLLYEASMVLAVVLHIGQQPRKMLFFLGADPHEYHLMYVIGYMYNTDCFLETLAMGHLCLYARLGSSLNFCCQKLHLA